MNAWSMKCFYLNLESDATDTIHVRQIKWGQLRMAVMRLAAAALTWYRPVKDPGSGFPWSYEFSEPYFPAFV